MKENNNTEWYAMSDSALLEGIGRYVKDARLRQNKTQQQVAEEAGINRSTIILLENGNGGTLNSLIQVLRVLKQLQVLQIFEVDMRLSPIEVAKSLLNNRQRASKHKK